MNELVMILQLIFFLFVGLLCVRHSYVAVSAFISLQIVLANIFVIKQIDLFGLCVTASDAYFISLAFTLNRTQEKYGQNLAIQCLHSSFMVLIIFMIATKLQTLYIVSDADYARESLALVFGSTTRIVLASLFSYWLSQRVDLNLYHYFRRFNLSEYTASAVSVSCSQALDTIVFSFLGLYGLVANIWHIIIFSYSIKVAIVLISFVALASSFNLVERFFGEMHGS